MNLHLPFAGTPDCPPGKSTGLIALAVEVCAQISASAAAADADARLADTTLDLLRSSGLTRAALAVAHGGDGLLDRLRAGDLCTLLRIIGAADLSVARIFEGHVNATALVYRYGTKRQIEAFADRVSDGALSGVWGADDARGLHATRIATGWRLDGRKILASGAGRLAAPIVTATTDAGQVLFLLDLADGERADASSWTAQGMRASATGSVDLTDMELRDDQLLGKVGDFTLQPSFSGGAWRFCAVHLGAAERLVDLFREHLTLRQREGDPYQLQRIADCVAAVMTARFWVETSARALANEAGDAAAVVALANMTRMVTERAALDVLEAVHRGVGLSGFIRPNPIERISRDLSTYLRQPVPDMAMANAAKWVLGTDMVTRDLWADHAR